MIVASLLWLLVGLWALLLFGGWVYGWLRGGWNADQTHRIPTVNRMVSTGALVAMAWLAVAIDLSFGLRGALLLFAVGISFGLLGDLFMARLIVKSEAHVLGGIAAFGIGHLAYITAIIMLADGRFVPVAISGWLVVGAFGWFVVVWWGFGRVTASERTAIHIAALPYALLLSATVGLATSNAIALTSFSPLIPIGAALFLLSDLILAAQLFNGLHFRGIGDVVWLTYGPGQMLIVVGMLASLNAPIEPFMYGPP